MDEAGRFGPEVEVPRAGGPAMWTGGGEKEWPGGLGDQRGHQAGKPYCKGKRKREVRRILQT